MRTSKASGPIVDLLRKTKKDIESRGWSWQASSSYPSGTYHFWIFGPPEKILDDGASVTRKLGQAENDSEEKAALLAFNAALKAQTVDLADKETVE